MDRISIKGLEIFANHGVFKEENVLGQKFVINIDMYTSTRAAGIRDDLKLSIDYGAICNLVEKTMKEHTYKLIEAVAEEVAANILLSYPTMSEVEVEVEKPWAPVLMPLQTVSVKIRRKRHIAYLGLGSNMGDRESYLDFAIDELNKDEYTKVTKVSDFIETEPYGGVEQDNFLNGCIEVETLHSPDELLHLINAIEKDAGRERFIHWGPRTLDLDILFYDQEIIDMPDLHIPHIDLHNRDFVLVPMNQIAPYLRHPVLNQTISQLLDSLLNKSENTAK